MSGIQQMLLGAGGAAAPVVDMGDIAHSLRGRAITNAILSRTFAAPTLQSTFTWSAWVKRGPLGTLQHMFSCNNDGIRFSATDVIDLVINNAVAFSGTKKFRDSTGWMHIVYRQKPGVTEFWVNGALVETTANVSTAFNSAAAHQLFAINNSYNFHGYLARICFVDGLYLDASDFAEANSAGTWISKSQAACKAIVDGPGNNNFMLDFDSIDVGNDFSDNNNDWTKGSGIDTNTISGSIIPDMTSNTTPSGVASAINEFGAGYAAWYAFDRVTASGNGYVSSTTSPPFWLAYEFGDGPKTVLAYSITSVAAAQAVGSPVAWTIEGWNGAGWDVLDTVTTPNNWGGYETRQFSLPAPATYQKFRLNVTATQGAGQYLRINEWALATEAQMVGSADLDWMTDTPSNNHATLNPLLVGTSALTKGNLTSAGATVAPTILPASGTWYLERSGTPLTWTPPAAFPAAAGDYNFGQRPFTGAPSADTLCAENFPADAITMSGSFTGNANANGPFVWLGGVPETMTINGNAVTWGTHADKTAGGFKLRTALTTYNAAGTNNFTVTLAGAKFKYANAQVN